MDKNNTQLHQGGSDVSQANEPPRDSTSIPTENKTTALVKNETLIPLPPQPSSPVLSVTLVASSKGKSKVELWSDSASKELIDEAMRRKDLERKLAELERAHQNKLEAQDASLKSEMSKRDASHNKRWRFVWGGMLVISAVLCCLAVFSAWEFLKQIGRASCR